MNNEPRGISTFTTKTFASKELAEASGLGSVHELKTIDDRPSDWVVRVLK